MILFRSLLVLGFLIGTPVIGQTVIAVEDIPAGTILTKAHVAVSPLPLPGALTSTEKAIGKTTRVALYANRPISRNDLIAEILVTRNQTVAVHYQHSGLTITIEGRALGAGQVGDRVKVMNNGSRSTVQGIVQPDGSIRVNTVNF